MHVDNCKMYLKVLQKFGLSILLLFAVISTSPAQKRADYGVLLKPGEDVLYTFPLKSGNKTVMVCAQKDDGYIVYRFGTKQKVELQYPAVLNKASWTAFRYSGYSRSGPNNAAMEAHALSFKNNNVDYVIYDNWDAEDDQRRPLITIDVNGKKAEFKGGARSARGSLGKLRFKQNLIENHYWDEGI